jgi:hypothetical protein
MRGEPDWCGTDSGRSRGRPFRFTRALLAEPLAIGAVSVHLGCPRAVRADAPAETYPDAGSIHSRSRVRRTGRDRDLIYGCDRLTGAANVSQQIARSQVDYLRFCSTEPVW